MSDIQVRDSKENETTAIISMIERVAMSPDVDVEKMERMLDMQERILNRNAMTAFNAAMAKMQSDMPIIDRNSAIAVNGSVRSKFASFDHIMKIVRPILQQYGFAVSFRTGSDAQIITVTGVLMHKEGHREETSMSLPVDSSGSKNAVQAIGSSTSYAKRYVLCALLNIATGDEDDDGEMADFNELSQAVKDIEGVETIEELQATFKRCWASFTGKSDRARLTAAKDAKKGDLL